MAYKSQVTNKYMGSSFAGRVNPGRENELTQLAKSLNTLSDAVPKGVAAYKDEQVKKAEEQLEYLKSTMSPEELNAYILKGEDPILSNKWATSVVDGNVGRFQAGEVIKNIRENYGNYDYEKQTLQEFYSQYLPDIASKSSSYKNGFGVAFNKWSSEEYMADADMRAVKATEKKHSNVINFLDNTVTDMNEYWAVMSSFASKLPSTGGQENFFLTTDEMNNVALQHAKFLVQNATSLEHFDKAMQILSMDRGMGKKGTPLGSLLSTKREDVGQLVNSISSERYRFETRMMQREDWENKETIKNLFVEAFVNTDINDDVAMAKVRQEVMRLDPASITTFDRLNDLNRQAIAPEGAKSAFLINIAEGNYNDDISLMLRDFERGEFPRELLSQALNVWGDSHRRMQTGTQPIYTSNVTYKDGIDMINSSVKKSFTKSGILSENYFEAARNSTFYLESSILEFEATGNRTFEERRQFMQSLGDYVTQMFVSDSVVDPAFSPYATVSEMNTELSQNQTDIQTIIEQASQAINQFDVESLIGSNLGEINLASDEETQGRRNEILNEIVYPQLAQAVIEQIPAYLQNNIEQFFGAMSDMQLNDLAQAMNVTYDQLYNAMAQYFRNQ